MPNLIQLLMMVSIDERPSDVERMHTMPSLLSSEIMFLLDKILMLIYAIINLLYCMSIHNISLLNDSSRQRFAVQHPREVDEHVLLVILHKDEEADKLALLGGERVRRACTP